MSLTAEQALKLQEEFPPEYIQVVPKAGRSLQYVSHGRVTQRLNEVDPDWHWEPLGRTELGVPATTKKGNFVSLWGVLHVGGSSRIGVGTVDVSGKGADAHDLDKELVSDFIRNAAMRFGVGLHLWLNEGDAKTAFTPSTGTPAQSLGDRVQNAASVAQGQTQAPVVDTGERLSEGQSKNLYRLWKYALKWDRDRFFQEVELVTGSPITDDRNLTKRQASDLIRALKIKAGEPVDDAPAPAPDYDPGPTEDTSYGYSEEPF